MPTSGAGDFSPDGKRLAYSPLFRDFRTWKRYEGGWAQDLYIYDLATADAKPFAVTKRTERDPMWIGDAVYFASDRDGTLNLYSYDLASEAVTKLTTSTTWDVRWPSSDDVSRIVYELDGELHVFDVRTKADQALSIFVPNDGVAMRPARVSAEKQIEDFELSPKGERALVVARGDVFTVPIEKGPTRNLTNTSNAHDKWARWSPDGKRIAFLSDRSGEDEVWLVDQAGGKPEQVTSGGQAMRYAAEWSAEGTRLAFSDKDGKLYVLTLADKKLVQIADDPRDMIRDYTWSPKGAYLAFSMSNPSGNRSLHIWSAADGQVHRVTDDDLQRAGPELGPRRRVSLLPERAAVRPADQPGRVELRRRPDDGPLRPHPEEGRQERLPAPVRRGHVRRQVPLRRRTDPDKTRPSEKEDKAERQAEGRTGEEGDAVPDRLRRPGLARDARPGRGRQLPGRRGREGSPPLRQDRRSLLRPRPADEADARHLLDQGPQGVDPGRGRRRLGGLA